MVNIVSTKDIKFPDASNWPDHSQWKPLLWTIVRKFVKHRTLGTLETTMDQLEEQLFPNQKISSSMRNSGNCHFKKQSLKESVRNLGPGDQILHRTNLDIEGTNHSLRLQNLFRIQRGKKDWEIEIKPRGQLSLHLLKFIKPLGLQIQANVSPKLQFRFRKKEDAEEFLSYLPNKSSSLNPISAHTLKKLTEIGKKHIHQSSFTLGYGGQMNILKSFGKNLPLKFGLSQLGEVQPDITFGHIHNKKGSDEATLKIRFPFGTTPETTIQMPNQGNLGLKWDHMKTHHKIFEIESRTSLEGEKPSHLPSLRLLKELTKEENSVLRIITRKENREKKEISTLTITNLHLLTKKERLRVFHDEKLWDELEQKGQLSRKTRFYRHHHQITQFGGNTKTKKQIMGSTSKHFYDTGKSDRKDYCLDDA